jgi:predicted nucleotidyltransferase
MKESPKEKLYKAFYKSKTTTLYYNQIKQFTRLSDSSLQNLLKKIKKEIIIKKDKAHTFIKLEDPNLEFTKLDIKKLNKLNQNVKIPIKEFLDKIPKAISFILLFGSSSRKQEKENSDLDILIVLQKFTNQRLQKLYVEEVTTQLESVREQINASSLHEINFFYTNIEEFTKNPDKISKEAVETGFCIYNHTLYYEQKNQTLANKQRFT